MKPEFYQRCRGVSELRNHPVSDGDTATIVGSGPSLNSDRAIDAVVCSSFVICLNSAVQVIKRPHAWLFGDGQFARYKAKAFYRLLGPGPIVVCNEKHLNWVGDRALGPIRTFTNKDTKSPDYLWGRWTIATVALSLVKLMGFRKVILVGVDLGRSKDGKIYADGITDKAPARQDSNFGEWRKWMKRGVKEGRWKSLDIRCANKKVAMDFGWRAL